MKRMLWRGIRERKQGEQLNLTIVQARDNESIVLDAAVGDD